MHKADQKLFFLIYIHTPPTYTLLHTSTHTPIHTNREVIEANPSPGSAFNRYPYQMKASSQLGATHKSVSYQGRLLSLFLSLCLSHTHQHTPTHSSQLFPQDTSKDFGSFSNRFQRASLWISGVWGKALEVWKSQPRNFKTTDTHTYCIHTLWHSLHNYSFLDKTSFWFTKEILPIFGWELKLSTFSVVYLRQIPVIPSVVVPYDCVFERVLQHDYELHFYKID